MRILIVGGGGREHALAWRLTQEGHEIAGAPGNPGVAQLGPLFDNVSDALRSFEPELVVIGPEDPLIGGMADELRQRGIPTFGPGGMGARLEASKAWSKKMMEEAGVPTAAATIHTDYQEACEEVAKRFASGRHVAIKASGAALGKGVILCRDELHARHALSRMLLDEEFGDAGRLVVVEDFLEGREFSILTVVSEQGLLSLPVAQDYKRVGDGDTGENTGGMGTYSPVPWVTTAMVEETEARIVRPIVDHLRAKGVQYSGVLFSGVMVVDGSLYCLEYNVRFGDPETQSVMRRVEGVGDLLWAAAQGETLPPVRVTEPAAVTVVAASAGYPATSQKGVPITLGEMPEGVVVFHAGTAMQDGQLVTNGGRVLAVSAVADDLEQARARAYAGMDQVAFAGKHFRSDIGH